ncbi:tetraspanin-8-like, partial [Olea europaea subsp. europaea]
MVRVSNNLVGILNLITLLLSIPIIGGGIWLSKQANTECERFLDKPVIALGVFILLVSIAGLVGSCCRVSCLLWVYLVVMFLLILLLFCFTIFAFVVTNKGAGEALSDRGYKEYRLGDYSDWLQKRVNNDNNWNKIRSCLQDSKICQRLLDDGSSAKVEDFNRQHLSSLQ